MSTRDFIITNSTYIYILSTDSRSQLQVSAATSLRAGNDGLLVTLLIPSRWRLGYTMRFSLFNSCSEMTVSFADLDAWPFLKFGV